MINDEMMIMVLAMKIIPFRIEGKWKKENPIINDKQSVTEGGMAWRDESKTENILLFILLFAALSHLSLNHSQNIRLYLQKKQK